METRKKLREEAKNAELRAIVHFEKEQELERKFKTIMKIIINGEDKNEMAVFTLNKIKEVLEN